MKILKIFNKFMTNHSSAAYQIVVIAVPKEQNLSNNYFDFESVDKEEIEQLEEDYNIEILSKTDRYNIYKSFTYSADEHGFYEGGDYGEDIMVYWENWLDDAQKAVDELKSQGIEILYSRQDCD